MNGYDDIKMFRENKWINYFVRISVGWKTAVAQSHRAKYTHMCSHAHTKTLILEKENGRKTHWNVAFQ